MAREVKVLRYVNSCSIDNVGAMMVDPCVELLCCASYILFVAFSTSDQIYNIRRSTG